jgi:hypothetical protein
MPYYIPDYVSKTTCIGNTLSTFNTSFSNLDTRLFQLSTYSVNSVNFLSSTMISVSSVLNSRINFLSSAMISVSSDLRTQIFNTSSSLLNQISSTSSFLFTQDAFLSSSIQYVSANVVNDYITQGVLTYSGGVANWNFSTIGNNAKLDLFDSITLNNPTGLIAGQTGNLIVHVGTDNNSITAYGDKWTFAGSTSTLDITLSAKNIISYYYDGEQLLSFVLSM